MGHGTSTVVTEMNTLPSPSFWANRRVLVTGHTGFKGSWLSMWLTRLGAEVLGISLPNDPKSRYAFTDLSIPIQDIRADIMSDQWIPEAIKFNPEIVFHLAAQPIVAEGYRQPLKTFTTNSTGVAQLLTVLQDVKDVRAAVIVTTDKVYDVRQEPPYKESDFLGGKDPYSASKAAAEFVVSSWPKTHFKSVTARAGNVVGGGDWASERLIPDLVRAWSSGMELTLRDSFGVRPWQHVLEPLRGYLLYAEAVFNQESVSPSLNFGPTPDSFVPVGEVVQEAAKIWAGREPLVVPRWKQSSLRTYAETSILTLESDLASQEIGWKGVLDWRQTLNWTIDWYQGFLSGSPAMMLMKDDIERYREVIGANE